MASFATAPVAERDASLAKVNKGYEDRAPYRDALTNLADGEMLKVKPEEGESVRAVKFRIGLAAKEAKIDIDYGDGKDDTILVWKMTSENGAAPSPSTRRRSKPKGAGEASAAAGANGTAPTAVSAGASA